MINFLPIIIFILILSFLVFIHELGHFTAAKKFKIGVPEFGMGIPPRLWGKKFGETLYSINWLPFGGFVRIKGEDYEDYDPKDPTNFINKKPWQKSVVLLAGIFMNLMVAFVIFYFTLGVNGFKSSPILMLDDYKFQFAETINLPNVITFVKDDSPASKADIQFADRIVKLECNGQVVEPKNIDDIHEFLKNKEGKQITVYTENINTGEKHVHKITPEYNEELDLIVLGIGVGNAVQLAYSTPVQKLLAGPLHSVNVLGYSFHAMGQLVKESIQEKDVSAVASGVSGPIGIFGAVKTIMETGGNKVWLVLLDLTALLSLSLAIMNLLPIPALDGGREVFVIYEWITGKRAPEKLESIMHQVGFVLLIGLLILITFKDVIFMWFR